MPHLIDPDNPDPGDDQLRKGHRVDNGIWQTFVDGAWKLAGGVDSLTLETKFPGETGEVPAEGYNALLERYFGDKRIVRNLPNGDLASIDPNIDPDNPDPKDVIIIAKAVDGRSPIIKTAPNGDLIAIDPEVLQDAIERRLPTDEIKVQIIVKAKQAQVPTAADIEILREETLESGQVVTWVREGASIKSYVASPLGAVAGYDTPQEATQDAIERGLPTDEIDIYVKEDNQGQDRFHFRRKTAESAVTPAAEPKTVTVGGQPFAFNPNTGAFTQVRQPPETPETFDPKFFDEDLGLFQQRSGAITQFATQSLDDIIIQSLLDGEFEKAFAFQDFQDRPTAAQSLDLALQFARSPADQQIISEIARGASTVAQGPFDPTGQTVGGGPRRVGPQPDFLIQAFNDFQRRTLAGREPTDTEANEFRRRFLEGDTQETDKLRQQIRDMDAKINTLTEGAGAPPGAPTSATATDDITFDIGRLGQPGGGDLDVQQVRYAWETSDKTPADRQAALSVLEQIGITGVNAQTLLPGEEKVGAKVLQGMMLNPKTGRHELVEDGQFVSDRDEPTPKEGIGLGEFPNLAALEASFSPGKEEDDGPPDVVQLNRMPTTPLSREQGGLAFFAEGGTARGRNLEIVGEEGPELVDLAPGSRVIPLGKLGKGKKGKKQIEQLRASLGARPMRSGGIAFDGIESLPLGLQQLQFSRSITPSRGNLLRAANLAQPSQQALQNLTPESVAIFRDQAALAGIPPGALQQELNLTIPGGRRLPQARFRPLQLAGIR